MSNAQFSTHGNAETAQERSRQTPDCLVPTHTCFDDVAQYVVSTCMGVAGGVSFTVRDEAVVPMLDEVGKGAEVFVVHGMVVLEGHLFAHAWVEHGPLIMETFWHDGNKTVLAQTAEAFHRSMAIQYSVRYTPKEAADLWDDHGYAGPWDPQLLLHMARRSGKHALHAKD